MTQAQKFSNMISQQKANFSVNQPHCGIHVFASLRPQKIYLAKTSSKN